MHSLRTSAINHIITNGSQIRPTRDQCLNQLIPKWYTDITLKQTNYKFIEQIHFLGDVYTLGSSLVASHYEVPTLYPRCDKGKTVRKAIYLTHCFITDPTTFAHKSPRLSL